MQKKSFAADSAFSLGEQSQRKTRDKVSEWNMTTLDAGMIVTAILVVAHILQQRSLIVRAASAGSGEADHDQAVVAHLQACEVYKWHILSLKSAHNNHRN